MSDYLKETGVGFDDTDEILVRFVALGVVTKNMENGVAYCRLEPGDLPGLTDRCEAIIYFGETKEEVMEKRKAWAGEYEVGGANIGEIKLKSALARKRNQSQN